MRGFLSVSQHKVDKKGRVSVPVSFRISLGGEAKGAFICFPSMLGPWLQAVTPQQMQGFIQQQDELGAFAGDINAYATLLFAHANEMIPDSDGRIVLPPELLAHAKIEEDIVFVGQGHFFSIWAPNIFSAEQIKLRQRALDDRTNWLVPSTRQSILTDRPGADGGGNG